MVIATGFYPDGIVLGGVSKVMAEQYAPDQLKKGLLKVPTLSNIGTTAARFCLRYASRTSLLPVRLCVS